MSFSITDTDFEKMKSLIYEKSGIHFSEINRPILESRLKERLKIANLETVEAYYKLITSNEEEMKILLDSVTTNLTRFFRNQGHMDAFERYIIPELVAFKKKKGNSTIKIWSAGCSTGEEPYTLAMIIAEILPKEFTASIIASDLSLKSLMTAKTGFYPESRMTGIPENYLSKYFEKTKDGYQVAEKLQKMIRFDYHNLKFDSGLKDLDIVFCRNVIIYFDEAAQENVISKFWNSLSNHAYLIIGHSESLFGMKTQFQFQKTEWATFYTKMIG
ncbi:MAG: protein-glutamate O-methyltransferase CheR [Spirochaetaceae bacterium]|nr:protein-glutamate O-methyltransferase CheR [Spirochaetaceae bacterium]